MIALQVVPAGTEDPEEKLEVCHLTGGGPSPSPMSECSTGKHKLENNRCSPWKLSVHKNISCP